MKKRGKLRLATMVLALVLVLCGLWADAGYAASASSQSLEYSYRRALGDLTDTVTGMRSVLQKAPYANTAVLQSEVSARLLEQSGGAKAALAVLPFPQEKTEKISEFLSQTGSYALSLSRRSAAGKPQTDSDWEILKVLEQYAGTLSEALQNAQAKLAAEGISVGRLSRLLQNVNTPALSLDDDFDEVAEAFSQFPALLYDGPFSDHIRQKIPLFLEGKPEVSEADAAKIAAKFLGCSPDELTFSGEGGTNLPVFSFTSEDSHVAVTKTGGEIAYFKKGGEIPGSNLDYLDALMAASKLLKEFGVPSFRETYYVINDNLCTINFAATDQLPEDGGEVICYPDLIKVVIECNAGGMVEYDAQGYLMNHRARELAPPTLSREEAAQSVSPRLKVESAGLAVIPTPGQEEVLCWEFHCTAETGQELLVYINGETGLEEQLYLLQKDDHGVLVL